MARTISSPPADAPAPPSTTSPRKVTKSRSARSDSNSRSTRQRSKIFASASSTLALQRMVEEAEQVVPGPSDRSRRKGKNLSLVASEDIDVEGCANILQDDNMAEDTRVTTERVEPPFPIMELPSEIRLEIYRACLTRPYNILLSKHEQQQRSARATDAEKDNSLSDSLSDVEATDDDEHVQFPRQFRPAINHPPQVFPQLYPPFNHPHQEPATSRHFSTGGLQDIASLGSRQVPSSSSHSLYNIPAHNAGTTASDDNWASAAQSAGTTGSNANWPSVAQSTGTTGSNANLINVAQSANTGAVVGSAGSRAPRRNANGLYAALGISEPTRNQDQDPLVVNILRASKQIYKEARSVLYSENFFTLDLNSAMRTLGCLHQRSRRQIKHVELEIPVYNEILERFQETVRLNLRYCSGLKKFVIHMPFTLPGADGSGTTGNTTVYANGFDILRWLPQDCDIILKGNICVEIKDVVNKHLQLAKTLDQKAYARRQLISTDTGTPVNSMAM